MRASLSHSVHGALGGRAPATRDAVGRYLAAGCCGAGLMPGALAWPVVALSERAEWPCACCACAGAAAPLAWPVVAGPALPLCVACGELAICDSPSGRDSP